MKVRNTIAVAVAIASICYVSTAALAAGGGDVLADTGAIGGKHFDAKGKLPSKQTIEVQQHQRETLPFSDKRDFEEQKRGFIAAPDYKQIMAEAGNVAGSGIDEKHNTLLIYNLLWIENIV